MPDETQDAAQQAATRDLLKVITDELHGMMTLFNARCDSIDRRFDALDARFDDLFECFTKVDQRFDGIDRRFDEVNARFDGIDRQFDEVNARFDNIDARFDGTNQRFNGIVQRLEGITQRFDALNSERKQTCRQLEDLAYQVNRMSARVTTETNTFPDSREKLDLPRPILVNGGINQLRRVLP